MKKILVLLFTVAVTTGAFAQKMSKEDMEAKIDTLTKQNTELTNQNTSLGESLLSFQSIYDTLKTNFFKVDFTAANTTSKMDSLMKYNMRSLDPLVASNKILQDKYDSIVNSAADIEAEKAQIITDLRNAKALLDEGILTEEEFMTIKERYVGKL